MTDSIHVLRTLKLPSRFEPLQNLVGSSVVRVLVDPGEQAKIIRQMITGIQSSNEGFFLPLLGDSGVGKTTLAQNLSFFYPSDFAPTLLYRGAVDREALVEAVREHKEAFAANDQRVLPINIDHREKDPPTESELAVVKAFLRERIDGSLCLISWPTTDAKVANDMSRRFVKITGPPLVEIPHTVVGPDRKTWQDTVLNTLALCNSLPPEEIRELGVDPYDHSPAEFATIGKYLKSISVAFSAHLAEMLSSLEREVTLAVVFVCESLDRGVLTEFTHGNESGLLDSHALLKACSGSRTGRWWSDRRGALTQSIFRANARAFWISPAATVTILRNSGPEQVREILDEMSVGQRDIADVQKYLGRSDLGKFLLGESGSKYVTQGRPPTEARDALAFVAADYGYVRGHDKRLNSSMASALRALLESAGRTDEKVTCEEGVLPGLVPDNAIAGKNSLICVEYAWRSGDFVSSSKRSEVAQYILKKVKDYAVALGWIQDA